MAFNSTGQVSYLVLDSLSKGSKYGLEIIEYISQKTGGNYIMKKPTLYSCLTRMEKKGYVSSSFWGESDFGGKRHYYTITNSGKQYLEELASEFANASFTDLTSGDEKNEKPSEVSQPSQTVVLQQDNLFNLVKEQAPAPTKAEQPQSTVIENQMDMFSIPETEQKEEAEEKSQDDGKIQYYQNILEQDSRKDGPKDDARILDDNEFVPQQEETSQKVFIPFLTQDQEAQNQRLYDELKKIRKKKSFSENQIEMAVVYETEEDKAQERERLEQMKKALLASRTTNQETFKQAETPQPTEQPQPQTDLSFQKEDVLEEEKDDAVYITNPIIEEHQIPIQKKITPPNIEINVYDNNLPAPKRNSNLEPTYKDMMAKLFERKKETKKVAEPEKKPEQTTIQSENYTDVGSFVDYDSLKKYYSGHGIEFKEYKKSIIERRHNTNFLNFLNSLFMLCLSGITSAILFGIIGACNALQASSNFLFYTAPIMFFVYCVYTFIRYEVEPSKKANLRYNSIAVLAAFAVATVIVFVIDIICGMQFETMRTFVTAILVPIFSLAIALPVNYYARKFLYNRFAK